MSNLPVQTKNSLKDIIDWLAVGDIVCLHANRTYKYYVSCDFDVYLIDEKRLIYVNLSSAPELMHDDEWSFYILNNNNNNDYTPVILPTNPDNIFYFEVPILRKL